MVAGGLSSYLALAVESRMPIPLDHPLLLRIADDLTDHGWSQQNIFLPDALTTELADECRARARMGLLVPAAVGRGDVMLVREGIRGDSIQWLEAGQSVACDRYLDLLDCLRQTLNRQLFLGLEDFEGHFAQYPVGAFYARHVDRFRDNDRRSVSAVLYLNDHWLPEHGGQLRLHLPERTLDIEPQGGCLVVFSSADIPHEVLPATRERLSLTGWFRRRGDSLF